MLEPEIEETQKLLDSMKNPTGYRDLKMLRACEKMLDMIRQLAEAQTKETKVVDLKNNRDL